MATLKIIPYQVKLRSTTIERSLVRPIVYTNDLRSAEFQFQVTDMQAGELSGATATTLLYMRDGSFFQNPKEDVELTGTTFSYLLKENEGNHAGIAKIQLVVYFNEGLANEQNFPTQLYEFEIINGLETKVAQEVMIYDWTTLTRDARAYIDEFVANEVLREAEFDNNEFDRNTAFVASQDARTLAFGTEQTNRGTAFTAEQNERTTAFNESESGRTTAETGRVTAEEGRVTAENDRVTKEGQRVTAESGRVTEEGKRVTAESGRVTAESGRATTFAGYNARITGMEADVNVPATNLVTNGDFATTSGWVSSGSYGSLSVLNNEATHTINTVNSLAAIQTTLTNRIVGNIYYIASIINPFRTHAPTYNLGGKTVTSRQVAQSGVYTLCSNTVIVDNTSGSLIMYDNALSTTDMVIGSVTKRKKVLLIDLTATFGKGNEPTAEQMDGILVKFANSWFDGTANLFRANATLNKLMAVDARTEFEAKNEVANGDFSNGTTGWAAAGSTIAVANNELAATQSVDWNSRAITTPAFVTSGTNMFYIAANVKATVNTVGINLDSYAVGVKYHSGSGAYERLSAVVTNSNPSHNLYLVDKGTLAVPARTSYVKNAIVINLTSAFGAGKEPTLADMDRLMARYPNSWFDGTKPIQTIETLYQEKANKAQEAWITPTLINSWVGNYNTQYSEPKYFKDEFGFVHIKGMAASGSTVNPAFILPIGYRPQHYAGFICGSSASAVAKVVITPTGDILVPVYSTFVHLDGIRFKVN